MPTLSVRSTFCGQELPFAKPLTRLNEKKPLPSGRGGSRRVETVFGGHADSLWPGAERFGVTHSPVGVTPAMAARTSTARPEGFIRTGIGSVAVHKGVHHGILG
jgi:hypothetical protein